MVLPPPLRELTGGEASVTLAGRPETVGQALGTLRSAHPAVYDRIVTERGELRQHVNLFVGTASVRGTGGLETPLAPDAEILVLASVSGG